MAPIRVGFVGLSASGSWAARAHIAYLSDTSKYTITALLNSSIEAAESAKKKYNLPSAKAYAEPESFATDLNIDLVVCSVRVDRHFKTVRPSIEAGKDCFVEWPLGANLKEAEELAQLARTKGVKTMVGLQARKSPLVTKLKQIIQNRELGKVLSSTVIAAAINFGATESVSIEYFADRKIGGNMVSIHFGHTIDYVLYALNDSLEIFTTNLSVQRPNVILLDKNGNHEKTITKDSHDNILLIGTLKSGAALSVSMRGGKPFPDQSGLRWNIYCERGEILVTSPGPFLQIGFEPTEAQIRIHDHSIGDLSEAVRFIDWYDDVKNDPIEQLPMATRNVARLYESFANGEEKEYAQWDEAVQRHKLLDSVYTGKFP